MRAVASPVTVEGSMKAFNVVRFRPKPGLEAEFERRFKELDRKFDGLIKMCLVNAGGGVYFSVGEWDAMYSLEQARPKMIINLDYFRDTLIDNGGGIGVTDPISGTVIHEDFGPAAT
jgi:hypothetical protein